MHSSSLIGSRQQPLVQTGSNIVHIEYENDDGTTRWDLPKIQKDWFTEFLLGINLPEDLEVTLNLGRMKYLMNPHVLFIGEGNFTFSVAFAALRKVRSGSDRPWNGIVSTCLGAELPTFNRAKVQCIATSLKYHNKVKKYIGKKLKDMGLASDVGICGDADILLKIRAILDVPSPPTHHWIPEYDALTQQLGSNVIWFQCPWAHWPRTVADLIPDFMSNAAKCTREGQLVCLGITTSNYKDYVKRYELERILGQNLCGEDGSTETLKHFCFLGVDTELIAEILRYGYRHHSDSGIDIHDLILPHHVTLVFRRKEDQPQEKAKN